MGVSSVQHGAVAHVERCDGGRADGAVDVSSASVGTLSNVASGRRRKVRPRPALAGSGASIGVQHDGTMSGSWQRRCGLGSTRIGTTAARAHNTMFGQRRTTQAWASVRGQSQWRTTVSARHGASASGRWGRTWWSPMSSRR